MSFDPYKSYFSFFRSEDTFLIVSITRSSVHVIALCAVLQRTVGVTCTQYLKIVKDEVLMNPALVVTFLLLLLLFFFWKSVGKERYRYKINSQILTKCNQQIRPAFNIQLYLKTRTYFDASMHQRVIIQQLIYSRYYVVGSKIFWSDIQKPRQMENAVRDIQCHL